MPGRTLTRKLIDAHLVEGDPTPGEEIALRIDQTLTQDATGTLVMQELEAIGLDRARTDVSVQYVDHNLLQADERTPKTTSSSAPPPALRPVVLQARQRGVASHPHAALRCARARPWWAPTPTPAPPGRWACSRSGSAASMSRWPSRASRCTCACPRCGACGCAASCPVVSAKDVMLEMLRRHGVKGGMHRIIEYYGPGLRGLTAMDRHVIANMGAELGATTTVFPADDAVGTFLRAEGTRGRLPRTARRPGRHLRRRPTRSTCRRCEPLIARRPRPATWCRCGRWPASRSRRS